MTILNIIALSFLISGYCLYDAETLNKTLKMYVPFPSYLTKHTHTLNS